MNRWPTQRLQEVCSLVKGRKPEAFVSEGGRPYLTAKVVRKTEEPKLASSDSVSSVWVEETDIVIIMDGSNSGEMFTGLNGALASTMGIVKCQGDILDTAFLLQFLSSHRDNFTKSRTGSAIPHLNREEFENLEIPLPPFSEQRRIVALLDEVFAGITKAKENAEKNLKNSRELFESYLQSVFVDSSKGWNQMALEELGQITSSKRIYKKEYVPKGIPFYRIKEIKELAHGKEASVELFISEDRYREIKGIFGVPSPGDILLTAVGTIGEMYVIENRDEFYFKDGNVLWLKDFKSVDPHYLKYVLMSFVDKIKSLSKGSAYSALTIEKIEKHKIFIPKSLSEQKNIVAKLDALSEQTKKLEDIYNKKIVALEELKKSVLKKAFWGEL